MTPRAPDAGSNRGGRRPSSGRWRTVGWKGVAASVRRFNQRARQRRLRNARPFLVVATIVALLGAVAWVVWRSPVLGVRQLRVVGNTLVTAEEVRAAAAVASGTPLAGV